MFFLLFHRFSVVVGCGIWLSYFMIITFQRQRGVFALTFKKFKANVHVTMKFHIQYIFNTIKHKIQKNFELFHQVFLIKQT